MLLVGPVYGYALFAVAVIAARFFAGAVVLIFVFLPELSGKFFLELQALGPVSL